MPDIARPSSPDRSRHPKQAIRDSAEQLFRHGGYAGTSVREIAAQARVDPALVIRHFGTKEALFLATMTPGARLAEVMNGPLEGLGVRLMRFLLDEVGRENVRGFYTALIRASDSPGVRERLQHISEVVFVAPITSRIAGPDAELRAHLFAAQVSGLMSALWVTQDRFLASLDTATIITRYGAILQHTLEWQCA